MVSFWGWIMIAGGVLMLACMIYIVSLHYVLRSDAAKSGEPLLTAAARSDQLPSHLL